MDENKQFEKLAYEKLNQVGGGHGDIKTLVCGPEADRPRDCPYCHGFLERLYPLFICPRCEYAYYCTD